ncbi:MAG: hypothetical protein ACI4ES_16315 [Roseburia sp.]
MQRRTPKKFLQERFYKLLLPAGFGSCVLNPILGEMGILLPLYGENNRNQTIAEQVRNLDKSMFYQFFGNLASLKSIELINENAQIIIRFQIVLMHSLKRYFHKEAEERDVSKDV